MVTARIAIVSLGVAALCGAAYLVGVRRGRGESAVTEVQLPAPEPAPAQECEDLRAQLIEARQAVRTPPPTQPAPSIEPTNDEPSELAVPPSETLLAAADTHAALMEAWDPALAEALFGDLDLDRLEAKLAWMRERVGDCGSPTPINTTTATQARFAYACERGVVEAAFSMSDPDADAIAHLRSGVRDVEPPPEVTQAARDAADIMNAWDPERFEATFDDNFREKLGDTFPDFVQRVHDELGTCQLGAVDLAGPDGALWSLDCEHGRRTVVVSLGGDGRISGLKVVPLRRDPG